MRDSAFELLKVEIKNPLYNNRQRSGNSYFKKYSEITLTPNEMTKLKYEYELKRRTGIKFLEKT
jgi:hypothetical protein